MRAIDRAVMKHQSLVIVSYKAGAYNEDPLTSLMQNGKDFRRAQLKRAFSVLDTHLRRGERELCV